jgi:hypothetical protein
MSKKGKVILPFFILKSNVIIIYNLYLSNAQIS